MSNKAMRPFLDLLAEHGRGGTHHDLTEEMHDLVAKVQETGKKGSITLKLTVEPFKNDDRGTVHVYADIAVRAPAADRKPSMFFAADGNLVRDDPNQTTFESLKEVAPANTPIDIQKAKEAK